MISYEISLGLSLVGVLMLAGSLSLRDIVDAQRGVFWGLFRGGISLRWQFIAFFIYLIRLRETNRIPFDLPEAETELVAGYHTEYSAMKFAMFFKMAEYPHDTVAAVASLLFLGGLAWTRVWAPICGRCCLCRFVLRFSDLVFLVRGTLPRFPL